MTIDIRGILLLVGVSMVGYHMGGLGGLGWALIIFCGVTWWFSFLREM